jgi:hypothetical protein
LLIYTGNKPGTNYTPVLTYSMEQSSSWEANRFLASQEIPRVLLNPKVHYRIYNCSPPVSILSQPNPVHTPTSHFLEDPSWYYPPTYDWVSPVVSFPQVSPPKPSLLPIRATCPAHLILDFITRTILGEEYRSLYISVGGKIKKGNVCGSTESLPPTEHICTTSSLHEPRTVFMELWSWRNNYDVISHSRYYLPVLDNSRSNFQRSNFFLNESDAFH